MRKRYRSLVDLKAHEKLFLKGPYVNLRFHPVPEDQETPVIAFSMSPATKTKFTRKTQIKLTDMDTDFEKKTTAVLHLVCDELHCARYVGSVDGGMGRVITYDVCIRTDITEQLRRRGVRACAEISESARPTGFGGKLFSVPTVMTGDYLVYTSGWENTNRPAPNFT
jgi:hypothetical protein